jgi:uncharacterized protein YqhQ
MAKDKTVKVVNDTGTGFVLFVAWIGAVIYFVQQSEGFWGFIVAVLQACVWPAYVMYEVLTLLNAG